MSFCGVECWILGRMREARDEVCEEAEVVHSVRIVVWWAMHALRWVSSCFLEREDKCDCAHGGRTIGAAWPG